MQSKSHWEQVYETKPATEVSWYQPHAKHSLDLIRGIGVGPDAAIIDVGSGLPVVQYDPDSLHDEFGPAFKLVGHDEESHVTPAGRIQHFIYCHCIKAH